MDEFYKQIRALCGYVENGSDTQITISQDDATKEWWVKVGKTGYHGPDLRTAVAVAYRQVDDDDKLLAIYE